MLYVLMHQACETECSIIIQNVKDMDFEEAWSNIHTSLQQYYDIQQLYGSKTRVGFCGDGSRQ